MHIKNILILQLCMLMLNKGHAQQCTDENVASLPGSWRAAMKGDCDHSAADMAREKVLLDSIAQFIRGHLTWRPVGGDITAGNAYSIRGLDYRPAPVRKLGNTYKTFIFFQHYFCNNGKINREDYVDRLEVSVNEIPFEFNRTFFISPVDQYGNPLQQDPETDKYGFISELPVRKNGYFTYRKNHQSAQPDAEDHFTNNHRLLTKGGRLPFLLMPKKEYYEKWKLQYSNSIDRAKVVKEKMEVLAKTTGNNADVEFEEHHIVQLQGYIDKINRLLAAHTAEELSRPAFSGEENGEFLDNNDPGNRHDFVIVPDLTYYTAGVPRSTPQIFYINFDCQYSKKGNKGGKRYADEDFVAELERIKMVDLLTEKLRPLLGN
ncbi:hypothetical protein Q4E93_06660 [Flavitalea sp. BT771]|uniref:hypothetical protein n=1 Tax=Flavitalea sp. BT771 TaxID=3063329 RepID=UPI0026E36EE9|nr:hypothetical protein [Flavitalea sp. BT771]MDO6430257.1 hypothetical protein [Flavitalea sp. BT771]MDV6219603.1 hypothetical protein [Flavitalea sp. BT771]